MKIFDEQLGGIYRVIVSFKDNNNYLYGEYERVDQTNARISVASGRSGGVAVRTRLSQNTNSRRRPKPTR